ncbi:nucleoside deaminase [Eubacterium multiforme]|uniref:tRNA-specific adenosine deaminase n=1 Tax=Eubacterium multiforme TaxID=83339 RepID=A0ABT9UVG6_9FIRM|nr:nucleoside deaminase [Eubacterium multiforme]MDQ0150322.1 tRNA(adenine34) deaminase [Eubacterium multiforme]
MSYINLAISEGKKALKLGEIPVGAVILKDGQVIGRGYNLKESKKSVIAHAEIIAIEEACRTIGDWRLNGCEMYVTLEPCPMCASAIVQSRISKLHIGTFNKDMGACGSVIDIVNNKYLNSYLKINWLYNEECSNLMTDFFKMRRKERNLTKK